MIGIDHSTAQIAVRERFAFTKSAAEKALQTLKNIKGVRGCVLLSTCNRMELYVSVDDDTRMDHTLCSFYFPATVEVADSELLIAIASGNADAQTHHHVRQLREQLEQGFGEKRP